MMNIMSIIDCNLNFNQSQRDFLKSISCGENIKSLQNKEITFNRAEFNSALDSIFSDIFTVYKERLSENSIGIVMSQDDDLKRFGKLLEMLNNDEPMRSQTYALHMANTIIDEFNTQAHRKVLAAAAANAEINKIDSWFMRNLCSLCVAFIYAILYV